MNSPLNPLALPSVLLPSEVHLSEMKATGGRDTVLRAPSPLQGLHSCGCAHKPGQRPDVRKDLRSARPALAQGSRAITCFFSILKHGSTLQFGFSSGTKIGDPHVIRGHLRIVFFRKKKLRNEG